MSIKEDLKEAKDKALWGIKAGLVREYDLEDKFGDKLEEDRKKLLTKNKFKITIEDDWFGELSGVFKGKDEDKAIEQAKNFYAQELYTFPESIQIKNVKKLEDTV